MKLIIRTPTEKLIRRYTDLRIFKNLFKTLLHDHNTSQKRKIPDQNAVRVRMKIDEKLNDCREEDVKKGNRHTVSTGF